MARRHKPVYGLHRIGGAVFALALLAGCSPWPVPTIPVTAEAAPGPLPSPPPWAAPSDPINGLRDAGIRDYVSETYATHIHAHLTVYYLGQPVTVPANLGIPADHAYIAPLHTHLDNGVLHLQAPPGKTYTLGQVFTVWGVPLGGALVYDRGQKVADPAGLVLQADHEIVVSYGPPPAAIPVDYGRFGCVNMGICE